MNAFEEATLRLKQQLGVTTDKEVAAALGMTPRAWVGRKNRGNFPERELFALVAKRPELKIAPGYVLSGETAPATPAMLAGIAQRIRALRGEADLKEFAEQCGLDAEHLGRLEAGTAPATTEVMKQLISRLPDVDPLWLLSGRPPAEVGKLTHREAVLIANYRAADPVGRGAIARLAAYFASPPQVEAELD